MTSQAKPADIHTITDLVLPKPAKDRFDQLVKKHPFLGVTVSNMLWLHESQISC